MKDFVQSVHNFKWILWTHLSVELFYQPVNLFRLPVYPIPVEEKDDP
jgi:hypothetical protein